MTIHLTELYRSIISHRRYLRPGYSPSATIASLASSEAIPLIPLPVRSASPRASSDSSDASTDIDVAYPAHRAPQTYADIRRHVRSFRSKADIQADPIGGSREQSSKMKLFDNLRGWTKEKRYRYIMLLGLSLAGDGWYVSFCRGSDS